LSVPRIIGHRGAAGHAPENTLASIQKAFNLGASWVEFDVMLSGDDVPILFHDDKLDRVTNGHGLTAETPLADLRALDAGSWFDPRFSGERIPSLAEAVALLAELGLGANVEIKPSEGRDAVTGRGTAELLNDIWPETLPPPLISSFSLAALDAFAAVATQFERALLVFPIPADWRRQLEDLGCAALHAQSRRLREGRARQVMAAGYDLRVFTVNRVGRARQVLGWGAAGVITDVPDRLLTGLGYRP